MSGAFEQAWLLLKSVFQPSQGELIGEGMNQMVYGMGEDPDVTKVGHAGTVLDMYHQNRFGALEPNLFASQQPILQRLDLPVAALSRFQHQVPVLSTQQRIEPLYEGERDRIRGRELAQHLQELPNVGGILEATGVADAGPRNWGRAEPQRGLPVRTITGDPADKGHAIFHDAMFYGPENPTDPVRRGTAYAARGVPRRLGMDYQVPEEQLDRFARALDELPFSRFIEPIEQSTAEFNPRQVGLLEDLLSPQEKELERRLIQMGVL